LFAERSVCAAHTRSFEATKDAEVSIAFKNNYVVSLALATGIAEWFERNAGASPDGAGQIAEGEVTALQAEFADHQQTLQDASQESKLIQEKAGRDNLNKRAITQNLKNVEAFWRFHPELHNPIQPDRSRIVVEEYETVSDGYEDVRVTKTRTVYDAQGNGKKETYDNWEEKKEYKEVRRSQADIEREKDGIYGNMLCPSLILGYRRL